MDVQMPPPFCPLCGCHHEPICHHEPAPPRRRWFARFRRNHSPERGPA